MKAKLRNTYFLISMTIKLPLLFAKNNQSIPEKQKFTNYYSIVLMDTQKKKFCLYVRHQTGSTSIRNTINCRNVVNYNKIKDQVREFTNLISVRDTLYRPTSIYNELMKLLFKSSAKISQSLEFYKPRNNPEKSFKLFLDEIKTQNKSPQNTKKILKALIDSDKNIQAKIHKIWKKDFEFYQNSKQTRDKITKNYVS